MSYNNGCLMEKDWNRKKLYLLASADPETLEAFWEQFVPVLYTWMYYQVGADEQLATELTGETLEQAIENLADYNPGTKSFFLWLKRQARQTRDHILEHRQLKPQRPWAWSQLPAEVLNGLERLRSEPLSDAVCGNPFVHEFTQATLAELDTPDRQLLVHRYNHLETEDAIAEEMDCSIEAVQNQLYRSRHSFRRGFFHLISRANAGFSEKEGAGDIEILDANLGKLLSSTALYQPMNDSQAESIRKRFIAAAEQAAASQPPAPTGPFEKPAVVYGAIAGVVLVVLAGIFIATQLDRETVVPEPPTVTEPVKPKPKTTTPTSPKPPSNDETDKEELELVLRLGTEGNLDALLELLKSGRRTTQIAAAILLGQSAGPEAIEPLEEAEQQWYPQQDEDNPFAQAIDQILSRYPDLIPPTVVDETPKEKPKEPAKKPPAKKAFISGTVRDFLDQPLADVTLELTENPLFTETGGGKKIASVKTDKDGVYAFDQPHDGPAYLTVNEQGPAGRTIRRSLWCKKDVPRTIDAQGRPALTGSVVVDGIALSNQALYLCETLDVASGSYMQQTETDADGNFTFLGVPPGDYLLLNMGIDKRLHRLTEVNLPVRDVFNVNVEIETADVLLEYPEGIEPSALSSARLVYTVNSFDSMKSFSATVSQDGLILFKNVSPGAYVLRVELDSGVWLQQDVEVLGGGEDTVVTLEPIPDDAETVLLRGRFLSISPVDLFLASPDQRIHADLSPQADGGFEIPAIPADVYTLASFVNGQMVEFFEVDLQEELEIALEIDPAEITGSVSPVHVAVIDAAGFIVSGAEVWLTGDAQIITSSSTGKGAFLAALPGRYTLSVATPGTPTQTREIEVKSVPLTASQPLSDIVLIELGQEPSSAP